MNKKKSIYNNKFFNFLFLPAKDNFLKNFFFLKNRIGFFYLFTILNLFK